LADHIARKYVNNLDAVAIDAGSTLQLIVELMMETKKFLSILTNNMTAFRRVQTENPGKLQRVHLDRW
jgi:DeoR/GlpR family transcriptional regulator of sugar metabolism